MIASRRIRVLQETIGQAGVAAAVLHYSRSTLYYAGTTQPSLLVITPDDYYLVVQRGLEFVRAESQLDPSRIVRGNGYPHVREMLQGLGVGAGRLGMELDVTSAKSFLRLAELFSPLEITDVSDLVLTQRTRKEPGEIDRIREACRIADCGHEVALAVLRDGMTELQLSAAVEDAHRRAGHEGLYFMRQLDFFMGRGPLASGENLSRVAGKVRTITGVGLSPSIPLGASRRKIHGGDVVVVDIPTHYHGYHCDQSRTYVLGEAPKACRRLYAGLREIADRTVEAMRPGVTCGAIFDAACSVADEVGMGHCFKRIGDDPERVPFVGHGIGLELNELPMLSQGNETVLEEGIVVALELEMRGLEGEVVKLEDTILVCSERAEILTTSGRELHEI